ncbi:hypothetical protein [Microbacterium sp.]|uniref:hypothetical protein n=1 Tax=Microbacterium sp. TaxID=51671 RepID=UPI0039E2F814
MHATTPVGVIGSRAMSATFWADWWMLREVSPRQSPLDGGGATPVEVALQWVDDIEAAGVGDDDSFLGEGAASFAEEWLGGRRNNHFPVESCASKSIVLVTDGAWRPPAERDPYADEDYVPFRQRDTPVHVLDVGVGDEEDRDWLIQLADDTGGTYSYVPTATDLAAWIEDARNPEPPLTDDTITDSDGDGLSDWVEQHGIRSTMFPGASSYLGRTVFTDPQLSDSDSDGLSDSEEVGAVLVPDAAGVDWNDLTPVTAYALSSDPTSEDGDGDGLNDPSELEFHLNALLADNDFDGLSDGEEEFYGTYSTLVDSDFDGFTDGYEAANLDSGYDPVELTKTVSEYEWLSELGLGMFCGEIDVCRRDSIPWLIGNIISGILVFGDVRDAIAGAAALDLPVFTMAAIGIIPGFGDLGTGIRKIVKAIEKSADSEFSSAALKLLYKQADTATYLRQIDEIAPTLAGSVRGYATGISDDALARLINANGIDRMKMMMNSAALKTPDYGSLPKPSAGLGWRGAEDYLHDLVGVPGYTQKATKVSINGSQRLRFFDAIAGATAFEAKVGSARNAFVKFQAVKDAAIKTADNTIDSIEWHFFVSSRTGKIGMSQDVLDTLETAGIKFVLHITGD